MDKPKLTIGFIGEAMIEMAICANSAKIGVAGDTLNAAVYMRRAVTTQMDIEIAFVSIVGNDGMSNKIIKFIENEGISTGFISRDPIRKPGLYCIETDEKGERYFSFWREASAARLLFQNGFDVLDNFDVIYLSAIVLAILPTSIRDGLLDGLEQWNGTLVFDSNYRPTLWENQETARKYVERAWRITDLALPSFDDEIALFGDSNETQVLARHKEYGARSGALKRGEKGPILLSGEVIPSDLLKKATKIVDTTAAGDSFGGTFLAKHLLGFSQVEAAIAAHEVARTVVGFRGAFES